MTSGIDSFSLHVPAGRPQMPGSSSSSSERRIARTRPWLKIITATECFTGKAMFNSLCTFAANLQIAKGRAGSGSQAGGDVHMLFSDATSNKVREETEEMEA